MNRTEEEEFIIGSIFLLANKLEQIGNKILPDITFKQWFLLLTISKMEMEEKNVNNIAEFFGTTRQNVKKMLTSLKAKGYVTICKSEHDARALKVELTEKTYQYFSDNDSSTAYEANQLFCLFSKNEIEDFASNLYKLLHSFEKYKERVEYDK